MCAVTFFVHKVKICATKFCGKVRLSLPVSNNKIMEQAALLVNMQHGNFNA
jgi:hypothetical protein